MKKLRITFICCCIILLTSICFGCSSLSNGSLKNESREYLRIHVRANSNSEKDQAVKYEARDLIVDCFAEKLKDVKSKNEAIAVVKSCESAVNGLIEALLKSRGFDYGVKIRVGNEEFPTRVYNDELVLEAGYYDAVIVELGEAKGDNWWCVVYPPLCFTRGEDVTYRSKIYDFIKGYNKK